MLTDPLDAVFAPRRIAVVGASDRPGTVGRLVWDNLAGFPGEVVPVSRAATVDGRPAYPDLTDVPGELDLVVVAVAADAVPEVIRSAAARGLPAAVLLSAGFAETGPAGAALQRETVDAARAGGVRLVGPNCFGVQNCDLPLNASIAAGLPPGGGISLVTQSGSYGMAAHTLGREESIGFAKVYAAGNAADLTATDVLRYLADDPATTVICLLLESIPDPRDFLAVARTAASAKPVLATVTGRSASGRRAAASHTASLAGDDALRDALLRQAGVVRTRTGLGMLDAARLLAAQPLPTGPRVGVVTNSGGTGVELVDLLTDEGLSVPELSPGLRARLAELLPPYASTANPVDITPVWRRFPELYPAALRLLAESGEVDVLVPVLLARAASTEVAEALLDPVAGLAVPVYPCWVAGRGQQAAADLLQAGGVPCLPWPERAAAAVGAAVRSAAGLTSTASRAEPARVDGPPSRRPVPERPEEVPDFLRGAGIPVVDTVRCSSPEEAAAAAARLGGDVVLKLDVPHKTDVGGVRLSPMDVRAAAAELLVLPCRAPLLVQPRRHGLELVVGATREPGYGPVVMVGLGGVHVEVLGDVRFALAPVTAAEAHDLLRSLRGAALLDGVRGAPPVDVTAVAELVATVSRLMTDHPPVTGLDLNPVLAGPHGCVAVDWHLRVR
ncbi:acetate--CoA ligase family protein [Amycolatopsis alkalitolerans]|uniref:Acetate--CoA ligase family protein n=1 Tax=Amycolatopsis alkalitolerans TaxID=2547244 RepID=A0A5C4M682_9PSEU|nr:acetate--CoA ligase family protein [Amycolatopsis alkalitolerans]TNC28257.1 acetate--CoA ligase family protein [Amycolatopsis alkalitolerans]